MVCGYNFDGVRSDDKIYGAESSINTLYQSLPDLIASSETVYGQMQFVLQQSYQDSGCQDDAVERLLLQCIYTGFTMIKETKDLADQALQLENSSTFQPGGSVMNSQLTSMPTTPDSSTGESGLQNSDLTAAPTPPNSTTGNSSPTSNPSQGLPTVNSSQDTVPSDDTPATDSTPTTPGSPP